jgi:hypothetical protein
MEPYDQTSGTVIQSSTPPKIVSSGSTIKDSLGDPAPNFTGGQLLEQGTAPDGPCTMYAEAENPSTNGHLYGLHNNIAVKASSGTLDFQRNDSSTAVEIEQDATSYLRCLTVFNSLNSDVDVYTGPSPTSLDPDTESRTVKKMRLGTDRLFDRYWGGVIKMGIIWQSALSFSDRRALALSRGMI